MNEAFEANMRVTFERMNESTLSAARAVEELDMAFHDMSVFGRLPPIPEIPPIPPIPPLRLPEFTGADWGVESVTFAAEDRPARRRRTKKKNEPEPPTPLIEQNAPRKMRIRDDE